MSSKAVQLKKAFLTAKYIARDTSDFCFQECDDTNVFQYYNSEVSFQQKCERVLFDEMYNLQDQNLTYWPENKQINEQIESFNECVLSQSKIKSFFQTENLSKYFKFEVKQKSNSSCGVLKISILSSIKHFGNWILSFDKNLALILGIANYKSVSGTQIFNVKVEKDKGLTLNYDLSKPLFGFTVHCNSLVNKRAEIAVKRLTSADYSFLYNNVNFCSMLNLTGKTVPLSNVSIEGSQFYFNNFFGDKIKFKYAELYITIVIPT